MLQGLKKYIGFSVIQLERITLKGKIKILRFIEPSSTICDNSSICNCEINNTAQIHVSDQC